MMGKHKKGFHKPDQSGLRSLWMLGVSGITQLSYRRVRSIYLSKEAYDSYYKEFADCSSDHRRAYRALLEANIGMWTSWMGGINPFKIALVSGVIASFAPLIWTRIYSVPWTTLIHNPLVLMDTVSRGIYIFLVVEIVFLAALIWALMSGVKVSVKIEKASFLLRVLEDVIENKKKNHTS